MFGGGAIIYYWKLKRESTSAFVLVTSFVRKPLVRAISLCR
jgi:hypothetical protein